MACLVKSQCTGCSPLYHALWVWFSSERRLGHENDNLLSFVFLPHIAHHAVPEEAVQCLSRWGRLLKNTKVVLFQRLTLKIGALPFIGFQSYQCNLNALSLLKVVVSWLKEDSRKIFFWTLFFFRKQDRQTLKAIKPRGQILMRVICCPK